LLECIAAAVSGSALTSDTPDREIAVSPPKNVTANRTVADAILATGDV
jgi:hypothetical protein